MKKVSLKNFQAIDVHCHPFVANQEPYSPEEFVRRLSLSVAPTQLVDGYTQKGNRPIPGMNMWVQILVKRLARYYSCEPYLEEVVEQRNARATNFKEYTQNLFQDVNLTGLVADFGYPTPMLNKNEFADLCGSRIWEIYRIEPVMVRLRNESKSFVEFIEKYRIDLCEALKRSDVVGIKSIIAYRSGLEILNKNENAALEQWDEFRVNERAEVKALRDYCLHVAIEECTLAEKVVHLHTGVGDGEVVLSKANPSLLLPMLRDKKYADTKFHLVHGGYPWMDEAAFIVSILPNVYMDISLQNPFTGHGVQRIISQTFEFAPFNKVMFGSDAFTVPEMNWLGVHLFKECFEQVLQTWIKSDYMDVETALSIGKMVLYENFERIYKSHINVLSK